MELRKLKLKEQYRSDEDDIVSDFLIPCLNNCIEYDRAVEYVTLSGLTTLSLGFHNSTPNARMRLISGHQFGIKDLNMMTKLFSKNGNKWKNFNPELIKDVKLEQIRRLVNDGNLMLKIGIPSSEEIDGTFSENVPSISSELGIPIFNIRFPSLTNLLICSNFTSLINSG